MRDIDALRKRTGDFSDFNMINHAMEELKDFEKREKQVKSFHGDEWNILLLLVLYTLQGIPMGLCGSIPLILKENGVSYEGLSLFSLVSLPFSLKLLWAPLVDSCYLPEVGRRKTWLIPVQILTGLVLIVGSLSVNAWLGSNIHRSIDVGKLSTYFFFLYFLMATQDIAVDGWALTMLSRQNVGYASICNSIGQTLGVFLANQGFIALSDPLWCHRFLGLQEGVALVNLAQFMRGAGWVFIVTTIIVWFGKREKAEDDDDEPETLIATYHQVVSIFKLRSVQLLCLILFTCKVAFSPADAVATFKLQEVGMSKTDLATISPLIMVVGLFLPAVVSKLVSNNPMNVFMVGVCLKLVTSLLFWGCVQAARSVFAADAVASSHAGFYASLIATMVSHEIAGNLMFISCMSFFSKVSDPTIGGTYMTLLNTLANLGSKWPTSAALWLLPKITFPDLDGFTIETFVCFAIGVLWVVSFSGIASRLQGLPHSDWTLAGKKSLK